MLLALVLLSIDIILGDIVPDQILQTPTFFNFNDPIQSFITSKDPTNINSTHNCLIVPCTVVSKQQNCMVITKLTYGGDCFTKQIQSSLNSTSDEDVVTLEFSYLAVHHPQAVKPYTGITVGWENQNGEIFWVAAEDISLITSGVNQTNKFAQFVTINSLAENTWTKVRGHIRPNFNETFRIIFEAFSDAADFAGQFLITNISIFDRGICSPGCSTCLSYYECTSCETGRLYRGACVSDFCYYDAGSITADKIAIGWVYEAKHLYGIALKNIKIMECHQVKFIMNKANDNYTNSSTPSLSLYQYGFYINSETLTTAGCIHYPKLPKANQSGYVCYFEFYLQLKNTTVDLVNLTWTQEFYFDEKNQSVINEITSDNVNMIALSQNIDLGTASTQVEGKVLLCQSDSCRSFYTEPQTLYLNDPFYVLVMLDNKYIDFGGEYMFELVSAMATGNGTSVPLVAKREIIKNDTATIYAFTVPFAVGNCTLQITAQLKERPIDNTTPSNRRRLLLSDNIRSLQTTTNTAATASSSGYSVSGQIKVSGFEILPGWKIYEAKNVPYIIIGVSAGFIVFLILCYCLVLSFWSDKIYKNPENEGELAVNQLIEITNDDEIRKIKEQFGES